VKPQRIAPQTYRIYGINGAQEVLNAGCYSINYIDIKSRSAAEKDQNISRLLSNYNSKVNILNADKFVIKYNDLRTQGIMVSFDGKIKKQLPQFDDDKDIGLLLGDQITDPQNLGQIIRTAECSGIDGLIIPDRGSAQITDSVLQVSQGAFVSLPIYNCGNVQQALQQFKNKGFWIVGVENDSSGKLWHEIDYSGKVIIVIGSEGKGIRKLVKQNCDFIATIPMQGKINSLNVSAAVSAILFERQRQISTKV
jgi:23S rRNA (guanosine2251-2'-O)-methyltransferase|tara:strand:- start:32 stop:787 length:756 start_codon:yes stop_codon:yes gene_type:complete